MIGVVGGIGPAAGAAFLKHVVANTIACSDQAHLPVCLISNPAVPDRTAFLEGREQRNPGIALASTISTLCRMGAKVIAVPCNTAHAPLIRRAMEQRLAEEGITTPILDIIEALNQELRIGFPGLRRVGLLATNGTVNSGLYQKRLAGAGITVLTPQQHEQDYFVQSAIYDETFGIKACSEPVSGEALLRLSTALQLLQGRGAEVVILGCTELSLARTELVAGALPLVDSLTVLARAAILATAPDKLVPLAKARVISDFQRDDYGRSTQAIC